MKCGLGATDDGMATVSILQLLSHFTNPRTRKRKRGLIALLNNGEEDYLVRHNHRFFGDGC